MDVKREVYEAASSGNLDKLKTLIQTDPFILARVSLTSFEETPLHIAVLRGDTSFVRELLIHGGGPALATKSDSQRRSPLHLASAMGHVEIMRELLPHVPLHGCLARDQDGRNPLQLAALNSQIEAMEVLIQKQPELVKEKVVADRDEQTILHLCVAYNRLEALEFLIGTGAADDELLNSKDSDGNTILHLAAILKQVQTTRYLLSKNSVKESANSVNGKGLTALDVMDLFPRDYKTMQIKEILTEARVLRAKDLQFLQTPAPAPSSSSSSLIVTTVAQPPPVNVTTSGSPRPTVFSRFVTKVSSICKEYLMNDDENWLEESRGYLVLASTLTATMAFQAGIAVPGGTWGDTVYPTTTSNSTTFHIAGTSILATNNTLNFKRFLIFNTLALLTSLSTILLMISRFPLKNKIFMSLLLIIMCATVMFTALAYLFSITMLTGVPVYDFSYPYVDTLIISFFSWIGVCVCIVLLPSIRIIGWFYGKLRFFACKWY